MASWVERDAAVVWHGFTQMASWAENEPVIVERGEGRELIDVDGRRYLDGISSLWVTTLGHRVPELDRALVEQAGRVAHSTLLGNGNRVVVELAEALALVVPWSAPTCCSPATAPARWSRACGSPSSTGPTWACAAAPATSPSAAPTTATPSARCRWATTPSTAGCWSGCASRCCARPASTGPTASRWPRSWCGRVPASWPRWWWSRWCRAPPAC